MALSVRPSVRRCIRPSVRSVVHNSCGQDIARTMWPRMLKLCVYTSHGKRKKPFNFQGQISRSLGLYKEFWHLDPCGQDIASTILSGLFKLGMYTSFEKRKKPIYFQGQKSNFKVSGPLSNFWHMDLCGQDLARTMQPPCSNLVCTLHIERGRSLFIFDRGGSHAGYLYSYSQSLATLYHITFSMFCNRPFHYLKSSRRFCILCIRTSLGIYFHNACMF